MNVDNLSREGHREIHHCGLESGSRCSNRVSEPVTENWICQNRVCPSRISDGRHRSWTVYLWPDRECLNRFFQSRQSKPSDSVLPVCEHSGHKLRCSACAKALSVDSPRWRPCPHTSSCRDNLQQPVAPRRQGPWVPSPSHTGVFGAPPFCAIPTLVREYLFAWQLGRSLFRLPAQGPSRPLSLLGRFWGRRPFARSTIARGR